jgi:small-conductance mechanosensitive channel
MNNEIEIDSQIKKFEQLEIRRKRNWFARYTVTLIIVITFLILIALLFFQLVPDEARDLLNILVGAYVAVLAKTTDYWFKEKEDPEIAEGKILHENGNGNAIG